MRTKKKKPSKDRIIRTLRRRIRKLTTLVNAERLDREMDLFIKLPYT